MSLGYNSIVKQTTGQVLKVRQYHVCGIMEQSGAWNLSAVVAGGEGTGAQRGEFITDRHT